MKCNASTYRKQQYISQENGNVCSMVQQIMCAVERSNKLSRRAAPLRWKASVHVSNRKMRPRPSRMKKTGIGRHPMEGAAGSSRWDARSPGVSDHVGRGDIDRVIAILGTNVVVRVAYSAEAVEDWIAQCPPGERDFGIDIEWRPNLVRGEDNKAALLQIACQGRCLIVLLLYIDRIPDSLRKFLANPEVRLGGVGVRRDSTKLLKDYGLRCHGEIDLAEYAADVLQMASLKSKSLATLCDLVLGHHFQKDKYLTMSDWGVECLSLPQVVYAATDAYISYSLLAKIAEKAQSQEAFVGSSRASTTSTRFSVAARQLLGQPY